MVHASMLGQEELRIFEELISRFDSLGEAEMRVVGVTPEWSAKDLLAHLAYWERAAAEEIREFEAGRWPAIKRTRGQMERINREVVSSNRATPGQRLREELIACRFTRRERMSTQLDGADAGPRSPNESPYASLPDALAGCLWFISRFLVKVDLSSSPFERNFVHNQFH
jgi:hypothetical protein